MTPVRWFVLTPTPDIDAWTAAVAQAVAARGRRLVPFAEQPDETSTNADDVVCLVEDASQIPDADLADAWGLMPSPGQAGAGVMARHGVDEAAGWRHASRCLAYATHRLGDRLIRPAPGSLAPIACGDLEILPPPVRADAGWRDTGLLEPFRRLPGGLDVHFRLGPLDLLYNDAPGRPSRDGVVDMTGRPRIACYGPYLWVPPGTWRATAEVELDAEAARQRLSFQWGDTTTQTEEIFQPDQPGAYRLDIDVRVSEPAALELRIVKLQGAISGSMSVRGLDIRRVG